MIRSGKLDQVIKIQELNVSVDSMGSEIKTWTVPAGAPTRAEYMPLKGLERVEANKLGSIHPAKLRIRRWAGLTSKHRIIHDGRTYRITSFDDYYRNGRDMIIHIEEIL